MKSVVKQTLAVTIRRSDYYQVKQAESIILRIILTRIVTGGGRKATRITLGIAVSIWLLAILCAVPAAVGSHLLEIKEGTVEITVCYPFPREWLNYNYPKVNVMMRFLILYVIPLTIIAIFYMNMANHLIVSTRNVPGEMQGTQRQVLVPQ